MTSSPLFRPFRKSTGLRTRLRVQEVLALSVVASFFIPARQYPLLFGASEAQIRVQDALLAAFVLAVFFGPAKTRAAIKRSALTWTGLAAAAFATFLLVSLVQVPVSEFAESATAVGKLLQFSVAGALAGVVLVVGERFLAFVVIIGTGVATNTAVALGRGVRVSSFDEFVISRPGGLLGPDVLAMGGAVAALAGLGLIDSRRESRRIGVAVAVAGVLAMLAGRSIFAGGAFIVGSIILFALLRRPPYGIAIIAPLVLLALVLLARYNDVIGATRLLEPTAGSHSSRMFDTSPPAVNLIHNGGCETSALGWNTNGRAVTVALADDQSRFGMTSCEVKMPGVIVGEGVFHNDVAVLPVTPYSLSAWVRAPRGAGVSLGIEWLGTKRQFLEASHTTVVSTGTWNRIIVKDRSPSNVASARATIYSARRKQSVLFHVDGVQLEQGNFATPYGLGRREPPINLTENDGFEANVVGWNPNGAGVAATRTTTRPKLGVGVCKVITPGQTAGEGIFHNRVAVSADSVYSFTVWVKARSRAKLALRIEWRDSADRVLFVTSRSFSGNGKWALARLVDARAPHAAVSAIPTIYTAGPAQRLTFYADGAFLQEARPYHRSRYASGSVSHRILVSYIGARVAADHPLTGVGWLRGSSQEFMATPTYERDARSLFPAVDPNLYPSRFPTHSHGAYVQTAADAGVPALLALMATTLTALGWAVRCARRLAGYWRVYAGIVAAMLAAIAFWFNSTPLFGGSLEVGLFWCAVGMASYRAQPRSPLDQGSS
jgi:O-Antigen ligase